jgi:hypothetical protein
MTIWHLLSAMAFFAPLISTLWTARATHVGIGGYLLSLLIGTVLGIMCAWLLWLANKTIFGHISQNSALLQALVVVPVLLVSIAWVALGGYCGELMIKALLRIV